MGSLTFITTVGLITAGLSCAVHAAKLEDVAPFPKAESGFTRQVIHLAPQPQEDGYQIEVLAGKTLNVDCKSSALGRDTRREEP